MSKSEQYEPMNFFLELQGFHDSQATNPLTPQAKLLWHTLMYIANKTMWKKEFSVTVATLEYETGLKKQAILNARNLLYQKGYIKLTHGKGNTSATYSMISQVRRPPAALTQPQSHPLSHPLSRTQADTQSDTEGDTINIHNNRQDNTVRDRGVKKPRELFLPPSPEEVKEYCLERRNGIDPERFVDYYTACGWRMGSSPIKDWRAAVRVWESRDSGGGRGAAPAQTSFDTDEFFEAALARSFREYEELIAGRDSGADAAIVK